MDYLANAVSGAASAVGLGPGVDVSMDPAVVEAKQGVTTAETELETAKNSVTTAEEKLAAAKEKLTKAEADARASRTQPADTNKGTATLGGRRRRKHTKKHKKSKSRRGRTGRKSSRL